MGIKYDAGTRQDRPDDIAITPNQNHGILESKCFSLKENSWESFSLNQLFPFFFFQKFLFSQKDFKTQILFLPKKILLSSFTKI